MNQVIKQMLSKYNCRNTNDYENALKEIIQEIALLGLWRSKFFEKAAFYGGSSLRILYGLDRFSEDLDFTLLKPTKKFGFNRYYSQVGHELESFGFNVAIKEKIKAQGSTIQSAFIKANTKKSMILVNAPNLIINRFHFEKNIKIKIEVDTDPPQGFQTKSKFLLQPIPFSVNTLRPMDLFSGKLHCILYRKWKLRAKGRDWYDLVWFVANDIPVNLLHLEERIKQSEGPIFKGEGLTADSLQNLLIQRIGEIDFELTKQDVLPFLKDPDSVKIWSKEFFLDLVSKINCAH